jgi:citrate lyase subunit beta / citryl-CoA lyase
VDRKGGLLRSLLFVPGSDTRKLGKVASFGADAVVIDLEDAVADDEKVGARSTTRAAIPELAGTVTVIVRVNGIETGLLDDDGAATAV